MSEKLVHIGEYVIPIDDIACVRPWYQTVSRGFWHEEDVLQGATIVLRHADNAHVALSVQTVWTAIVHASDNYRAGNADDD